MKHVAKFDRAFALNELKTDEHLQKELTAFAQEVIAKKRPYYTDLQQVQGSFFSNFVINNITLHYSQAQHCYASMVAYMKGIIKGRA